MRKVTLLIVVFGLSFLYTETLSQTLKLEKAELEERFVKVYGKNNEILDRKTESVIKCRLSNESFEITERSLELLKSTGFTITQQSLDSMESEGLPHYVRKKLDSMINQEIRGEEQFSDILRTTIKDEAIFVKYDSLILLHAKRSVPLPDTVADKLKSIKDQEIIGQQEFSHALGTTIRDDETLNNYDALFSKHAYSTRIVDAALWSVYADGRLVTLDGIKWAQTSPKLVRLVGPFEAEDKLTVGFGEAQPVFVNIDSATVGRTKWGFGKGKAVDFNLRRLTEQEALHAFDFDLKTKILERYLSTGGEGLWFRSLSLDLTSEGTVASHDQARNGTQSSVEFAANPYYFVGGLIYGGKLSFSYQLETQMNSEEDKLFDVAHKQFKFGVQAEVPYSNYPIYKLHTITGYVRLAMPLRLSLEYLPEGEDGEGYDALGRLDFKALYELAFSPYLIVRGEWHHTRFFDVPAGVDKEASYYSLAFAQDLDVLKKTLGFWRLILGGEDEIRGKHFMFYMISSGRKAPAFQDVYEQSLGFGIYF